MPPADPPVAQLERLIRSLPFEISRVEPSALGASVDVVLTTSHGNVVVRIASRGPGVRALALTRSFAVSYVSTGDAGLAKGAVEQVVAFARRLAAVDPGGIELASSERLREGPRLRSLDEGSREEPGGTWSRAVFDRNVDALRAERRSFESAVLVVTQACEMACTFCPSSDKAHRVDARVDARAHLDELVHQLEAGRALGAHAVQIGGNDVLRFERAIELFEAAGTAGYEQITAQSPGQRLADRDFARALAAGPLTRLEIPIYGATAAAHDAVTGTPGSFEEVCRAIDVVGELGRPAIALRTLALRKTLHQLDELIRFAETRFGLPLEVRLLRPNRVGERDHLGDAVPFPLLAEVARRHPSRFSFDVPLCVLPDERRLHGISILRGRASSSRVHLWDLGLIAGSDDDRVKAERQHVFVDACEGCSARSVCAGILRAHEQLLGTEGIRAV